METNDNEITSMRWRRSTRNLLNDVRTKDESFEQAFLRMYYEWKELKEESDVLSNNTSQSHTFAFKQEKTLKLPISKVKVKELPKI